MENIYLLYLFSTQNALFFVDTNGVQFVCAAHAFDPEFGSIFIFCCFASARGIIICKISFCKYNEILLALHSIQRAITE